MADSPNADWETCVNEGCIGVRVGLDNRCFIHTGDDAQRRLSLRALTRSGALDFTRGLEISAKTLGTILSSAPTTKNRHPLLQRADFSGATFGDGADFSGATFGDGADFSGVTFGDGADFLLATFGDRADFSGATFGDGARFHRATFGDVPTFSGATFGDGAHFVRVTFGDGAHFVRVTFGDRADFSGVTFGDGGRFFDVTFGDEARFAGATFGDGGDFSDVTFGHAASFHRATFGDARRFSDVTFGEGAAFSDVTFGDGADFSGITFGDGADFSGVTFGDGADFSGAFGDGASFHGATFGDQSTFGPLIIAGHLDLRRSVFGQRPRARISAESIDFANLKATDGGLFDINGAAVILDGADFARHTVIAGSASLEETDDDPLSFLPETLRALYRDRGSLFRVISLRDCDLRDVVFANVDLRGCRFAGGHGLDQLQLEPTSVFRTTPSGFAKFGLALPPVWRWSRRDFVIAEEHEWRAAQRKSSGWDAHACDVHAEVRMERDRARQIAVIYRSLRKGREDRKDEPGAADFYYGEMDMRRKAAPLFSAERFLLWLYWLTSGYALRTSRSLVALLVVLLTFAWLFHSHGFSDGESFWRALTYSAGSATAIFGGMDRQLTTWGEAFRILLRVVGPALLALAALSLRGRVKR